MDNERLIVDLDEAQALFDALPAEMQWPTLSPAYVVADALRDPQLTPIFLVSREGGGILMHAVHEARILRGGGLRLAISLWLWWPNRPSNECRNADSRLVQA